MVALPGRLWGKPGCTAQDGPDGRSKRRNVNMEMIHKLG
jgi:hypothetical protein